MILEIFPKIARVNGLLISCSQPSHFAILGKYLINDFFNIEEY